jgi:hypothetical protein
MDDVWLGVRHLTIFSRMRSSVVELVAGAATEQRPKSPAGSDTPDSGHS